MPIIRINFNSYDNGEQYQYRLLDEANRNFQIFLRLLSSYWQSTIEGPFYTREIKAISLETARIRLTLEDIWTDTYHRETRTEFLYQILTSILFPDEAPNLGKGDLDFRSFLVKIVEIYFRGSIPESIKQAVELVTRGTIVVTENFKLDNFDISDQFGFNVDVIMNQLGNFDLFLADKNIRILLKLIRPAHTLYKLSYIINDEYNGNLDEDNYRFYKIIDEMRWNLRSYNYEDFRKFCEGIERIDFLGVKNSIAVINESHSGDF